MSGLPPTCTGSASRRCRHYVRAKELKAAGMDWTDVLAAEDENPARSARGRDTGEQCLW